jgi:hypothetical protein
MAEMDQHRVHLEASRAWLWATDVHLEFLEKTEDARRFGEQLRASWPDAEGLLLSGDNAVAPNLGILLHQLRLGFAGPVYFVLGNHDCYGASFETIDRAVDELCRAVEGLHWLRRTPLWIDERRVICGNDGFYDARHGNEQSPIRLTDFVRIEELFAAQDDSHAALLRALRARADELAAELDAQLASVFSEREVTECIVVTHVPPFRQAALYEGVPANDDWAPFMSSRAIGDVLQRRAERHEATHFTVLCGHTHAKARFEARANLVVHVGGARYGEPKLAGRLLVEGGDQDVQGGSGHGAGSYPGHRGKLPARLVGSGR